MIRNVITSHPEEPEFLLVGTGSGTTGMQKEKDVMLAG
jgi:hypothetical protein